MTDDRPLLTEMTAEARDGDFLPIIAEAMLQMVPKADLQRLSPGRHERTAKRGKSRYGVHDPILNTRLGSEFLRLSKVCQSS